MERQDEFWANQDVDTHQISAMRVHLASRITSNHVYLGLVHEADDLNVVGRLRELDTRNGTLRHDPGTMPGLRAPGDHLSFNFANGSAGLWRSPEAEICAQDCQTEPLSGRNDSDGPSSELRIAVWHRDSGPSVVELHRL